MTHPEVVVPVLPIVATIALTTLNRFKRLSSATRSLPAADDSSFTRLDERIARLEQAVDVIAVEMERIGESQRFLTRVLTERQAPASTSGAHEMPESARRGFEPYSTKSLVDLSDSPDE